MKIVGYHYIRTYSKKYPNPNGIRFIDINNFCEQLNFFKKNFYLPSLEEFIEFKNGNINLPKNSIILSFDDGLKDHYKFVFPELLNRKMWGIFFIPSRPYIHKKLIGTFALHHLLGRVETKELIKCTKFIIENLNEGIIFNLNKIKKNFSYLKNADEETLFLKKLINSKDFFKTEESKDILVDQLLEKFIPELELYDIFLKPKEIKEMENSGMCVGAHSITHNYMSDLSDKDQFIEIDNSFKILNKITGKLKYKFFGFPYGKLNTVNQKTFSLLYKLNVDAAFLFNEPKLQIDYDINNRQENFQIPRIRPDYFDYGDNYRYL